MKVKNLRHKKTCPRCGIKVDESIEECPDCGLIFSRLDIATNKDAKNKIKRHDRQFIIYTSNLPSDVNYIKLLLLVIFTGGVGGHCFYTGRYLRGSVLLIDFLMIVLITIFNAQLIAFSETLVGCLCTILGFVMFLWFYDIVMVVCRKFKVPIAIDLQGENLSNKGEN